MDRAVSHAMGKRVDHIITFEQGMQEGRKSFRKKFPISLFTRGYPLTASGSICSSGKQVNFQNMIQYQSYGY